MERERFEQELLEYVEGRLGPARTAAVDDLLSHDPKMRARVVGMQRAREQLMDGAREMDPPSGGVERAISRAEREALLDRPAARGRHPWRLKLGTMAAVIALAGVASWWALDFAIKAAKGEGQMPTLPLGDSGLTPLDGYVEPGVVPIGSGLAERINELANDPAQGGFATDLESQQQIAAVGAATAQESFSIDKLDVFSAAPEFMGPVYVLPIDDAELRRAVTLAGLGRLRLVVELRAGAGEEAAYEYLTFGVLGHVQLAERTMPWGEAAAGSVSADEALPGDAEPSPENSEIISAYAVFRQEGHHLAVIDSDDLTDEQTADEIQAIALRARDLGGVLRVHGHEGKAMQTVGDGVRYELLIRWVIE
jgi:hypothetical protein